MFPYSRHNWDDDSLSSLQTERRLGTLRRRQHSVTVSANNRRGTQPGFQPADLLYNQVSFDAEH